MDFNEMWSFVAILTESVHLLPRIWKITTPLAAVVIFLPSLFFLFYNCSHRILQDRITDGLDSTIYGYMFINLAVEIVFLLVFGACSHLSGISTILVSAAACTGKRLPPSDLVCRVRKSWKRQFKVGFRASGKSSLGAMMLGVFFALMLFFGLINPITICLFVVLSIAFVVYVLKSSVGEGLALVGSVVEESCSEGTIATERGEKLVEGQRLKGFMLNLSINILAIVCLLVFWVIVGDKGPLNMTIYGLFFVTFLGLFRICVSVVQTVFYFQCKKYHGEEIDDVLEQVQYPKLPVASA